MQWVQWDLRKTQTLLYTLLPFLFLAKGTASKFHLSDEVCYKAFSECTLALECSLADKLSDFSSKFLCSYCHKCSYAFLIREILFFFNSGCTLWLHVQALLPVVPCGSIKNVNSLLLRAFPFLSVAKYIPVIEKPLKIFCSDYKLPSSKNMVKTPLLMPV